MRGPRPALIISPQRLSLVDRMLDDNLGARITPEACCALDGLTKGYSVHKLFSLERERWNAYLSVELYSGLQKDSVTL